MRREVKSDWQVKKGKVMRREVKVTSKWRKVKWRDVKLKWLASEER